MTTVSIFVYASITKQSETSEWVRHTHKAIESSREILTLLVDMETGERGFLITGKEEFLEPYHKAQTKWHQNLDTLKEHVSDNPLQVTRLIKIATLQTKWIKSAAEIEISARRKIVKGKDMSEVIALIEKKTGKNIIDQIRLINDEFIQEEERLMILRQKAAEQAEEVALMAIVFGMLSTIIAASCIAFLLAKDIINNVQILLMGTRKIAEGNLNTQIKITSKDEFLLLANAFNHMATALKHSNQEIKVTAKAKSDFLANMSHEIRTPIGGVLGMIALLEDTELTKIQKSYVDNIRTCGDGLLLVINDILDVSKLATGEFSLEKSPFDLKQCIDEVYFILDSQASNKGLTLEVLYQNELAKSYLGDKLRIRQILLNLINNAIKFTEHGEIQLVVNNEGEHEGHAAIHFQIKDSGIGISNENQKNLFKPFSQADNSISRQYGGTGLGLSISSQLVKQMGGEITVKSEINKGSVFYFTVNFKIDKIGLTQPLSKDELEGAREENSCFSENFPLSILIAEDNKINQIIVRKLFEKLGYEFDLAINGQEAVEAVNNKKYDVVFMDMQMPIMDGITATLKIIESHRALAPKIIAMTANVLDQDRERCALAGMVDFVGKPINLDDITAAIKRVSALLNKKTTI